MTVKFNMNVIKNKVWDQWDGIIIHVDDGVHNCWCATQYCLLRRRRMKCVASNSSSMQPMADKPKEKLLFLKKKVVPTGKRTHEHSITRLSQFYPLQTTISSTSHRPVAALSVATSPTHPLPPLSGRFCVVCVCVYLNRLYPIDA